MNVRKDPLANAVAIVGMSCRFPNAASTNDFWSLLINGKDTIEEIPKERWNADRLFDPDPMAERKTYQRQASLLKDIHHFDPLFFNISPAEANEMSPSQKLMLELSWEAIESSTVPFRQVQGKNVSVYVGNIWSDFEHYRKFKNARPTLHSAVGMSSPVVANRVSFALGLTGPSLVVDTGCSASLVALHLACQSLVNGESVMALTGGINHIMDPDKYIELTRFGGLSRKGRCSSFDSDADGFVRGEGGGVLLLKKLTDAERDGDRIFAVIRSTAVNNNGFNDTLPATSTAGQIALLEAAYGAAGIAPGDVHYVEAHGTGTKLGDPNEARAIGEFFRHGRKQPLRIGSVKTNIGHTEATAGIAGLIKVVLAMQNDTLPHNLNFRTPNPDIPFDELMLTVQNEPTAWPAAAGETYKAGVNSFGWGGTNAHAVLEQYVSKSAEAPIKKSFFALPLSAKSPQALVEYARHYAALLDTADEHETARICLATALVKADFDHRFLFSGSTREELLAALNGFVSEQAEVAPVTTDIQRTKVVFVFPGQGAQWLGMGRNLMSREPVFREMIHECATAFEPYTDWSLTGELEADAASSRLNEINVIQPVLFAMQVSIARLWMSWGLKPHAVVGHSMGEVAAAYTSGALKLDDAARIICTRSRLMKTVSGSGGAMAVTELGKEDADKVVERYQQRLSVAVHNSPKSTVLAGDKKSIDGVLQELERQGLFGRLVKVDVASHSPQMDPLMEPLRAELTEMRPVMNQIPFYSTVRAAAVDGGLLDGDYWVSNLRGTVRFAPVLQKLMDEGHTIFVECNPHPVLMNAVHECADSAGKKIVAIASTAREKCEHTEMRRNLGELYSKGYSPEWSSLFGSSAIPHISLPLYPFQREQYEIEDLSAELPDARQPESAVFPLLGTRLNLAGTDHTFYWESVISLERFPFLKDHLVNKCIQLPTSCYMEVILEAVEEVFTADSQVQISNLVFTRNLVLSERDRVDIQIKLLLQGRFAGQVTVFEQERQTNTWQVLASGNVRISEQAVPRDTPSVFEELEYHEPGYTEGLNYYNLLRTIGFDFGKHFHHLTGIDSVGRNNANKILFSIRPDAAIIASASKFRIHPALLSAFFQPLLGQLTTILEEGNHMRVRLQRIDDFVFEGEVDYNHEIRGLMIMHEMKKSTGISGTWSFTSDIVIANYDNSPVMTIKGLQGIAERMASQASTVEDGNSAAPWQQIGGMKSEHEKLAFLQELISRQVGGIVKMPASRIRTTMTFKGLGLDSLMAVQLRNHLEKDFQIKIPVGMFWAHPTIQDYALFMLGLLAGTASVTEAPVRTMPSGPDKWCNIPRRYPDAPMRLFCFHDAGGSAALFDGWEDLFNDGLLELVVIELPGRGRRLNEPPVTGTEELLAGILPALQPLLDKPYVFLGHSMGGLVAFEVMHELRKSGQRLPETLFISSTSGLNAYDKEQVDYRLDKESLVKLYPHLDLSVVKDAELQEMLVGILKADLQLLYNHQYRFEVPFNVPILAIHGEDDQRVSRYQIEQWEKESFVSFRLVSRPGGHRYIEHDAEFVTHLIQQEVRQLGIPVVNQSHVNQPQ